MFCTVWLAVFLCYACTGVWGEGAPRFPASYSASGVLKLPYAELEEPFRVERDAARDISRVEYYGGVSQVFMVGSPNGGISYKLMPVTDDIKHVYNRPTCFLTRGSPDMPMHAQTLLPDLTNFTLVGAELKRGHNCSKFAFQTVIGARRNRYYMWVSEQSPGVFRPVEYEMKGFDQLLGSHFDHYIMTYDEFTAGPPAADRLVPPDPSSCRHWSPGSSEAVYLLAPFTEFLEPYHWHVDAAFSSFRALHSREYQDQAEHQSRRHHFTNNLRLIHAINRQALSFRARVNHLADRRPEELRKLRGYRYSGPHLGASRFPYSSEEVGACAHQCPADLDWRLEGAVSPVEDQAVCGSCWSFGAAGHVESTYFLHTGSALALEPLSEQALVDCSWGEGNFGCDGGEDVQAYEWMLRHGLPSRYQYGPYRGVDGLCQVNASLPDAVHISGYVQVPSGDLQALKLSMFTHGPISVAIDASHPSFSFYSHGVYYEPLCGNRVNELDHAVLAVGYGRLHGHDYWLVKNSWSTHWGNDGYVLMSQRNNNCGVATASTFVTFK